MNPPFFFFSSLLFCSLLALASADDPPTEGDPHPPMDCFPTNCGNVTNITYPFWVVNQQPSHCGYPAFKLACENHMPMLDMSSEKYRVKKIDYENHSVVLVDTKVVNSTCPVQYSNTSFSLTPFSLSPANKQLVFLFDCYDPSGPVGQLNYYKIPCSSYNGKFAYASMGDQLHMPSSCEMAVMPVLDHLGDGVGDYLGLLENGFLVNWTVAECDLCLNSKGQCGYNNVSQNFMCICLDRAHYKSCDASSSPVTKISNITKKKNKGEIIGIVCGAVGGFVVLSILVIFCYKRKKRYHQSGLSGLLSWSSSSKISSKRDVEVGESNYHTHIFSYDELEEATGGFNASRELGDGGFGTVYKGKLRDGRTVAVKRLYDHNYRRLEQFMNEVEILSRLRHQNLVTLYGCTSRHSRELLLVYEYIPNGTVGDHLHGSLASKASLSWPIRLSIAIETADALAYLHHVEPQIIHRDVKTNNILLDNNHHVKVADFGLSRLFPLDATHVSTAPQGTPGYVDPEYHQCYQLTDKSDVYSFGVVLIELVSSKPAVDISRPRHEINLANLAVNKIQNCQLDQLVDPNLGYDVDLEVKRMIDQVTELAFRCLQSDREMRPGIREVLEMLRVIEDGGYKEGEGDGSDVMTKEESRLLKRGVPVSPDTVTGRWPSRTSTPNTST